MNILYDLVTFDIFDTLVHRKLRAPVDVFEAVRMAVQQDRLALLNHDILAAFTHQRILAEREAREILSVSTGGEGEVNFDEIYDRYQALTGCDDDLRHLLQEAELKLEKLFLFASDRGLQKFRELKAQSKQVAFISDMYLPSAWLGQMLRDVGFAEIADLRIFVSCEFRKSKHSGALYQEVRNQLSLKDDVTWLHVGDNLVADIDRAKEQGIQTLVADWALVNNNRQKLNRHKDGYLIESLVDFVQLPQAKQFLPTEDYAQIGYRHFGPLIFGFLVWTFAQAREAGLKHLAFVARDGWLPFHLFTSLKQEVGLGEITESYVYFSRTAGHKIGVKEWDVDQTWVLFGGRVARPIDAALQTGGYDVKDLPHILERFGFEEGGLLHPDRVEAGRTMVATTFEVGLKKAYDRRLQYSSYFEKHFLPGQKIGLVDIGWNGNIQRYLIGSLDHRYDKSQFVGLFLGLHSSAVPNRERGLAMHGWLSNYGNQPHVQEYLQNGGVELLEFALTADHGTTLDFAAAADGSIEPVLEGIQPEEATYRERAMKVQSGIRKFVDDYRFLLSVYDPALLCSTAWSLPFERLVTDPQPKELDLLADLSHSDTAGVTSYRLPLAARQPDKIRKSRRKLRQAREDAFWKFAFDRLNS